MAFLRSALFNLFYVGWTLVIGLAALPVLLLPPERVRPLAQAVARAWLRGFLLAARWILGLSVEVRGRENLPRGGGLIAAKHQSAVETFLFHQLLKDPVYILKKELLSYPLVGAYMRAADQIAVDRAAGAAALKAMVRATRAALDDGRTVIIFPEGTRVPPGETRPYHPGVAALYTQLEVPVVPVALNSGLFWPRNSFVKRPGRIVVEILPPIPPGLSRRAFLATLSERIEGRSRTLADLPEAGAGEGSGARPDPAAA